MEPLDIEIQVAIRARSGRSVANVLQNSSALHSNAFTLGIALSPALLRVLAQVIGNVARWSSRVTPQMFLGPVWVSHFTSSGVCDVYGIRTRRALPHSSPTFLHQNLPTFRIQLGKLSALRSTAVDTQADGWGAILP